MKNYLTLFALLVSIVLISCKDTKKEEEETKIAVQKIEAVENELDEVTQEIDAKADELEESLKDLDSI